MSDVRTELVFLVQGSAAAVGETSYDGAWTEPMQEEGDGLSLDTCLSLYHRSWAVFSVSVLSSVRKAPSAFGWLKRSLQTIVRLAHPIRCSTHSATVSPAHLYVQPIGQAISSIECVFVYVYIYLCVFRSRGAADPIQSGSDGSRLQQTAGDFLSVSAVTRDHRAAAAAGRIRSGLQHLPSRYSHNLCMN